MIPPETRPPDPAVIHHIDEVLHRCIHCGMCLPVCPTYALTQQEESSPRGRIRLIRSLYDGTLGLSDNFVDEMYFCLDCQACQTACPAGVRYGSLVEDARRRISEQKKDPNTLRLLKTLFLKRILASKQGTRTFGRMLRWYRRSGLQDAVDESGILGLFSPRMAAMHALLPKADAGVFDEQYPEIVRAQMPKRGTVGFLSGCIMNVAFSDIHRDAVEVLTALGFDVVIPKGQVCCGSLHGHNGDIETARQLARLNVACFRKFAIDALVVDSAGCSAFLKEYDTLLTDDPGFRDDARLLASQVKDITEFLAVLDLPPVKLNRNVRVTYHDPCHLVHTQKISAEPRSILRRIGGAEFVELPESTWCCGSAGIYNLLRHEDSMKMLERKIQNLESTNADIVVTANPGCHLQLAYGIRHFGLGMKVMHPVSLLKEALSSGSVTQ
ncbi:MAG TPA: (Fe-S)-binding protein [Bacteroidota bacterium]|nr:(Fe-S)-binding protein [Bacteroidota bacterium]